MNSARRYGGPFTDLANCERLVAREAHRIRYVPGFGYMVNVGSHWERDDEELMLHSFAKDTARALWAEAAGLDTESDRVALSKWANQSERRPAIEAMVKLARSERSIRAKPEDFDRDPMLFNVKNGTVHLPTGVLRPHRREDFITHVSPANFDAEAKAQRWEHALMQMMNRRIDAVDLLCRAVGYSLTGLTTEQKLFFLHGNGSNGKGAFMRTIERLLGTYTAILQFSSLLENHKSGADARPDLAKLVGKRIASASESTGGRRIDEGLVKSITGGDTITARHLFKGDFDFQPAFKLWLCSNDRPTISGTDWGIWRRILLIPFEVQFVGQEIDETLEPALQGEELSGILNWAIRGCQEWLNGGLRVPDSVLAATNAYRTEQDVVSEFINDRCELGMAHSESASALLTLLNSNLSRAEQYSAKRFANELKRRSFHSVKSSAGMRWVGLRIVPDNAGYAGCAGTLGRSSHAGVIENFPEVTAQAAQAAQGTENDELFPGYAA